MEESNQFLEENAITYDTEADEKVIPEDVVYVYSGNAMNMEEVFQFSCLKTVEPVIVKKKAAAAFCRLCGRTV